MKYALLLAVLVGLSVQAKADSLLLGGWSVHLASDYDYNEEHNLVAYERNKWIGGYFKNSFNRDTYFVGRVFNMRTPVGEIGVIAGAMRGYTVCYGNDDTNADVCPMIVPYWEPIDTAVAPRFSLVGNAVAASFTVNF